VGVAAGRLEDVRVVGTIGQFRAKKIQTAFYGTSSNWYSETVIGPLE
jgi:hypothetical protein